MFFLKSLATLRPVSNVFSIILVNTFNPVVVLVVAVVGLAYDWLTGNDYKGDRLVMGGALVTVDKMSMLLVTIMTKLGGI